MLGGFDFDGEYFYVSGMNLLKSTKYKNVQKNPRVALVVDDLKLVNPWEPRGIRIYGIADIVTRQDGYMQQTDHPSTRYIRIKPLKNGAGESTHRCFSEARWHENLLIFISCFDFY